MTSALRTQPLTDINDNANRDDRTKRAPRSITAIDAFFNPPRNAQKRDVDRNERYHAALVLMLGCFYATANQKIKHQNAKIKERL